MTELVKVLMERDELTEAQAKERVEKAKQQIVDGYDIEEILEDLGVEPDYIMDLI